MMSVLSKRNAIAACRTIHKYLVIRYYANVQAESPTAKAKSSKSATPSKTESSQAASVSSVESSKILAGVDVKSPKTVAGTTIETSKTLTGVNVKSSKAAAPGKIESSKTPTGTNVESSKTVTAPNIESSKTLSAAIIESSKTVAATDVESSKGLATGNVDPSKIVAVSSSEPSKTAIIIEQSETKQSETVLALKLPFKKPSFPKKDKSSKLVPSPKAPKGKYGSTPSGLDLSFEDGKQAYLSKTNWEVIRAMIVYRLCTFETLMMNSKVIQDKSRKYMGDTLFSWIMRATFYGHFVAGDDEFAIKPVLQRMMSFGVRPILDYSVEEDITPEKGKELDKKSIKLKEDGKHEKQFQFSDTLPDRRYQSQTRAFFYVNEASCERNMETFLRCLEALSRDTNGEGITAVKVTALGRPSLLLHLSEVIMRTRKYMNEIVGATGNIINHHVTKSELQEKIAKTKISDQKSVDMFLEGMETDAEGIVHIFPWSGIVDQSYQLNTTFRIPDLKSGKMVKLTTTLAKEEEEMFKNMIRRMNTVVKAAEIMGSRVMVDAEQTYLQPAITRLTVEFMRKYNKSKMVVLNTYQTYLRAAYDEAKADIEQARRQNFCIGAKVVRGAYIEQERMRAKQLDYPDPTNPNIDATTKMYYKTCNLFMEEYVKYRTEGKKGCIHLMVATHNEDTVRFAIKRMAELNISSKEGAISFGQLLGMCDHLTFPLGQAGYEAFKYVPYGPLLYVLPYLIRRADENKGIWKVKKERRMLRKEFVRRMLKGQIIYTPKPPK